MGVLGYFFSQEVESWDVNLDLRDNKVCFFFIVFVRKYGEGSLGGGFSTCKGFEVGRLDVQGVIE